MGHYSLFVTISTYFSKTRRRCGGAVGGENKNRAWRKMRYCFLKTQVDFVKNSDILVMKLVVCISKYVHANGNKLLTILLGRE